MVEASFGQGERTALWLSRRANLAAEVQVFVIDKSSLFGEAYI